MKKIIKTKCLFEYSVKINSVRTTKRDLENILECFIESDADYCEIIDDEVDFYQEREETDAEYESRLSSKKLVEKVEFERAKKKYMELKDKFE